MSSSTSGGNQFPTPEIASLWRFLAETIDRFIAVAVDVPHAALHWAPPAPETNSIAVLLVHTLGNIEENVLEIVGGEPVNRDRDAEFVEGDLTGAQLAARWEALKPRLVDKLTTLPVNELDRERHHARRGTISGRDTLLVAIRHAGEHLGQSELTRDLWRASQSPS